VYTSKPNCAIKQKKKKKKKKKKKLQFTGYSSKVAECQKKTHVHQAGYLYTDDSQKENQKLQTKCTSAKTV